MKKIFTKEVIIGVCVIAAIVILIVGIEFLKGVNVFKPANFYVAEYDNVSGLETAAPVQIDGFKVGQVREINFNYDNPGKIEVLLALNKNLRIPEDSQAIIGSTLLSGSYIEIRLGKSNKMLDVGGRISTGTSPDLMASLSNDLLPAINGIVPKVDSLLISLNNLASDPALLVSIKNLESITGNVNSASESLDMVMKRQVPGVFGRVDGIADNIDGITSDLKQLSAQLKSLPLDPTLESVNSSLTNVNKMSDNLLKFSNNLNNPNSTMGMLMNDPELYNRINRVTADIDSLILDIQKNPKRYISIKLF